MPRTGQACRLSQRSSCRPWCMSRSPRIAGTLGSGWRFRRWPAQREHGLPCECDCPRGVGVGKCRASALWFFPLGGRDMGAVRTSTYPARHGGSIGKHIEVPGATAYSVTPSHGMQLAAFSSDDTDPGGQGLQTRLSVEDAGDATNSPGKHVDTLRQAVPPASGEYPTPAVHARQPSELLTADTIPAGQISHCRLATSVGAKVSASPGKHIPTGKHESWPGTGW